MRMSVLAMLAVACLVSIALPCAAAVPAGQSSLRGILIGAWGDPHPHSQAAAKAVFALAMPDGQRVTLDLNESVAASLLGEEVDVTGTPGSGARGQAMSVSSIRPTHPRSSSQRTSASAKDLVATTKRVLYLLVKFNDDTAVPHPPGFYLDMNNPDTPPAGSPLLATINGFFKKVSYGQFSWIGDVGGKGGLAPTNWITLAHPKSYYANCNFSTSCANLSQLFTDAMTLAQGQGIDLSVYDNVNVVLSNDLDCCAWGGGNVFNGRYYGATWEPPWGQEVSVYSHEMGHSIGLPHSGWVYYAYDSNWDTMSQGAIAQQADCGTYVSRNNGTTSTLHCVEPGSGYIASYVDHLGWFPAANVVQVDAGAPATVTLEALSEPLAGGVKMIRICFPDAPCSGDSAHYLTVESRIKGLGAQSRFDNGLPGEGVLIHDFRANRGAIGNGDACFFNSQSGWSVPIDATPGDYRGAPVCDSGGRTYPDFALHNAEWLPGSTYVDAAHAMQVAVVARTGNSYTIELGSFTSRPTAPTQLSAVGDDGQVTLSWSPVGSAQSYNILMGTARGAEATKPVLTGITESHATVTGLTNKTRYFFKVVAVNQFGKSPKSKEISAVPIRYIPTTALDLSGLSGPAGTELRYTVKVPSGAKNLVVHTTAGSGDIDLYMKLGSDPTTGVVLNDDENCVPYLEGGNEKCEFAAPKAGIWHILAQGYTDFTDAAIVATHDDPERTAPAPFQFIDASAAGGQQVKSNLVTVKGINAPAPISISGDPSARYRINGGAWLKVASTVVAGDHVQLRLTLPTTPGVRSATVDIGGVTDTWSVTTSP